MEIGKTDDAKFWAIIIHVPVNKPPSRPIANARQWSQLVYNPRKTAGNIWITQILLKSWRLIARVVGKNRMKANAPTFTTSELVLAVFASSRSEQFGRRYSR